MKRKSVDAAYLPWDTMGISSAVEVTTKKSEMRKAKGRLIFIFFFLVHVACMKKRPFESVRFPPLSHILISFRSGVGAAAAIFGTFCRLAHSYIYLHVIVLHTTPN